MSRPDRYRRLVMWQRLSRIVSVAAAIGTLVGVAALLPNAGAGLTMVGAAIPAEQLPQDVATITVAEIKRTGDGCCSPLIGPDGNTYAFFKGRELWLGTLNGQIPERKVAPSAGSVYWFPNGTLGLSEPAAPPALPIPSTAPGSLQPMAVPTPSIATPSTLAPTVAVPTSIPDIVAVANRKQTVPVSVFDPKTNQMRQIGTTDQPNRLAFSGDTVLVSQDGKLRVIDSLSGSGRNIPNLTVASADQLN